MVMGFKLLQQLDRFPPVNQQMLTSYQNTDSFVDCVTFYTEPNSFLSLIYLQWMIDAVNSVEGEA